MIANQSRKFSNNLILLEIINYLGVHSIGKQGTDCISGSGAL